MEFLYQQIQRQRVCTEVEWLHHERQHQNKIIRVFQTSKQKRNVKNTLQNAESATCDNPKKQILAFQYIVHKLEPKFFTKKNEFQCRARIARVKKSKNKKNVRLSE